MGGWRGGSGVGGRPERCRDSWEGRRQARTLSGWWFIWEGRVQAKTLSGWWVGDGKGGGRWNGPTLA